MNKTTYTPILEMLDYSDLENLRDELNEILSRKRVVYSFNITMNFEDRPNLPDPTQFEEDLINFIQENYGLQIFEDYIVKRVIGCEHHD
jgi:hypothetical protein